MSFSVDKGRLYTSFWYVIFYTTHFDMSFSVDGHLFLIWYVDKGRLYIFDMSFSVDKGRLYTSFWYVI